MESDVYERKNKYGNVRYMDGGIYRIGWCWRSTKRRVKSIEMYNTFKSRYKGENGSHFPIRPSAASDSFFSVRCPYITNNFFS